MVDNNLVLNLERSNATRLIVALLEHESMSFTELMKYTSSNPRTLSERIKELSSAKIITVNKEKTFPFRESIKLTNDGIEIAKRIRIAYINSDRTMTDRAKILLYMMHQLGGIIKGTTRMEKLPFLLEKEYGIKLTYNYEPMEYGPYSIELLEEINLLEKRGFLTVSPDIIPIKKNGVETEVERRLYCLTTKGKMKAEKISKELPLETTESVQNLEKYNDMELQDLLDYVHKEYPNYQKQKKNC